MLKLSQGCLTLNNLENGSFINRENLQYKKHIITEDNFIRHLTEYIWYEGCSNMNASSFITFVKYMLRQNDIRFYKGLYVTFKLAPDLKKNTVYLLSYSPLNEGYFCILTNSMLRTFQWYRRAYNSSINRWNFLNILRKYPHILI